MSFAWFTFFAGVVIGIIAGYFLAGSRMETKFVSSVSSLRDEVEKLQGDVGRLRDALIKSEEEREKLARFNVLIPEIVRKFTTSVEAEDIPFLAVRSLKNFFNAEFVAFFVPDVDETYLLHVGTGYDEKLNGALRVRAGEGIVGVAIEHRKTINLEEFTNLERHSRVTISELEKAGLKADLVSPLIGVEGIYGAVVLGNISFKVPEEKRYLSMISDIISLAYDKARILMREHAAGIVDEVTGVYTKGYFAQRFSSEIRKAENYLLPLSLVMIDVDNLREIIDEFGYEAGNRVLRYVAGVAKAKTRRSDFVARYESGRFVIVMISSNKEQAYVHASRIIHEISGIPFKMPDTEAEVSVTVSAGVSAYTVDGTQPSDLISAVERALFEAKSKGGNRVVKA